MTPVPPAIATSTTPSPLKSPLAMPCTAWAACNCAAANAAPAVAGEARCVWEHLPEAGRAAVLAGDLATTSATMRAAVTNREYAVSLVACGVTDKTATAAGRAINAYALQLKAQQVLASDANLAPDRLDAAWRALGEALKSRLARHAVDNTADPDITFDAVQAFADGLGLTGSSFKMEVLALTYYVLARSALAVYEPRF